MPVAAVDSAQAVLDALPDGVVIADGSGLVTQINSTALKMLDFTRTEALGRRLSDVVTLQDQKSLDWFTANDPYAGLSTRVAIPEQTWFLPSGAELLVTGRLNRPSRGAPVDQVALVLRSSRGRARLDRERSDLVATVAHELRSPLTGVKGFVATLLSKWDRLNDDQKKLMLTTVNADSDRLSRLITELLDVARIDTGRLPLYPRPMDPAPAVQRIVDSIRVGTGRTIVLDAEEGLPQVHADPDKFIQVVTNLVDNAVRHGEGVVQVDLRRTPEAAAVPGVLITIDDQGEGIPAELRARVFTKFWKHGARGGTGLGMYIVNGLVRVHGGHLEIDDAPGGGARLRLSWPTEDLRQS